jgi:L-asparaginase II
VPPVLVVQVRGSVVESRHRGAIVEVDRCGSIRRAIGDPETLVNLRSTVKPFGLVALVEAGGAEAFQLTAAEMAVMAGSHSGEDLHVRTLRAVLGRAEVAEQSLACGSEGAPLDRLTAARLASAGEEVGPIRHQCSGQQVSILLLCRLNGWPLEGYWLPGHPVQQLYSTTVARAFDTPAESLVTSTDSCGVPTYAFPLREVARAFAMLADPAAIPDSDPRSSLSPALLRIRDAIVANPEMLAGSRDRLDSSVMNALPGRVVVKGGSEGLCGMAILPRPDRTDAAGVALKVEDGGGFDRALSAATVAVLDQLGVADGLPFGPLDHFRRPLALDPRGAVAGMTVADFELAPAT